MMKFSALSSSLLLFVPTAVFGDGHVGMAPVVSLGPRPAWLVHEMRDNSVKEHLEQCLMETKYYLPSDFSIGHRGACMQFPEHTLESYEAAANMGAGIIECDVTFTADRELVCRHAQCDLHTTTNVVTIPELNAKCTQPFVEGDASVSPNCCASDFTLEELKTMCAKMDSAGSLGGTAQEYAYGGTADFRTDLYQYECATIPTHKESIELIKGKSARFTPELKTPQVEMPFEGDYTQEMYAQQMIDEYIEAGVPPEDVWPQSFLHDDVYYWIDNTEYGAQAVALDGQYDLDEEGIETLLDELVSRGVNIVAPPMQRLVDGDENADLLIVPSFYAMAAKERGLDIITWTLERTGPGLEGFYWGTLNSAGIDLVEGDKFNLLYVLAFEVEVLGVFSDWPATTTFFANCYDVKLMGEPKQCLTDEEISDLSAPGEDPDCKTIAEIACGTDNFSTLCDAVVKADLADALSSGTWTVFAPTNVAFGKLPSDTLDTVLADTDLLTNILLFHVVAEQALYAGDLICAELTAMANGEDSRTVCTASGAIYQKGSGNPRNDMPQITSTDIAACNGVIHVVEEVMLP